MKNLSSFQFQIWTDGRWDMCSFRAEMTPVAGGLRYIWFVLQRDELEAIVAGKSNTAQDGYHHLSIMGDTWWFYDMEIPREMSGTMKVPFVLVTIPQTFVKLLARVAKWTWVQQRANQDAGGFGNKVILDFSKAQRERACRLYGAGTGEVAVQATAETEARVAALAAADEGFADQYGRIIQIARNSTRGRHQTASVSISKDWDGFYWVAKTPSNRTILNGGLVNHGKDGKQDWSLHT